jgi:hypothetical protein
MNSPSANAVEPFWPVASRTFRPPSECVTTLASSIPTAFIEDVFTIISVGPAAIGGKIYKVPRRLEPSRRIYDDLMPKT